MSPRLASRRETVARLGRMRVGFWLVTAVYALAMLGGTLPVPLYVFWAPEMGFGPFTTTLIFAVYALGVVLALVMFASLSDRSGRRPLLTSSATATAALDELAGKHGERLASTVATAANLGGLGIGTAIAGVLAEFAPDPTHLVFWIYLAALAPALAAVALTPETVGSPARPVLALRRPTVPGSPTARRDFVAVAAAVFAAFAVNGLFSSLVPSFLVDRLHVRDVAVVGGVVGLLFIAGLLAQITAPSRWLHSRPVAPGFLLGGAAAFEAGLWAQSLPVFLTGTVLTGIGGGLTFRNGVTVTASLADPQHRADLFASYFLAAYTGLIVPTLILGVLDQMINQNVATLILVTVVAVITVAAAMARTPRSPNGLDAGPDASR